MVKVSELVDFFHLLISVAAGSECDTGHVKDILR